MTVDELRLLCQTAARDLCARHGRPVPTAVIVPAPDRTNVTTLSGFPDEDEARHLALSRFAADRMVPANAPCFGFVSEAELGDADTSHDVLVVAYGATRRGTWITAAPLGDADIGEFGDPEPLDPAALPFLQPLQHAADLATPGDGDVLGLDG